MHRRKRKIGIAIEKLFARALPLDGAIDKHRVCRDDSGRTDTPSSHDVVTDEQQREVSTESKA
jgi:hypothetical protein